MTSLPINKQILALRTRRGLTQAELAERTGMRQCTISAIECAVRQNNVTVQTLRRLAKALDADLEIKLVEKP
jgi:transcriptional regulator with XRE-family HTH domain